MHQGEQPIAILRLEGRFVGIEERPLGRWRRRSDRGGSQQDGRDIRKRPSCAHQKCPASQDRFPIQHIPHLQAREAASSRRRAGLLPRPTGLARKPRPRGHSEGEISAMQCVYRFGEGRAEGRAEMRDLLGGKGANLAEMCNLGLPVPPGFTITTEVCDYFYKNGRKYPPDLIAAVDAALAEMARLTGRKFGDNARPLLVSVRSGARAPMPGMMD